MSLMVQTLEQDVTETGQDFLPLLGTDYVEFYVGNARQSVRYYESLFGFELAAYRGPETGTRDRASYLLVQNKIRFVLTTALQPEHEIAAHVHQHGDGVHDIALWVDDADFRVARNHETRRPQRPSAGDRERQRGRSVPGCHRYLWRHHPHFCRAQKLSRHVSCQASCPLNVRTASLSRPAGLLHVDHMVGNVGWGEMRSGSISITM